MSKEFFSGFRERVKPFCFFNAVHPLLSLTLLVVICNSGEVSGQTETDLWENVSLENKLADVSLHRSNSIIEEIPEKYLKRYQKWKKEFLSTELGQEQWEKYANSKTFVLTIKVSPKKKGGAEVTDYLWDGQGHLIAATMILGRELDEWYPSPNNYPVTSTLALSERHAGFFPYIRGSILAATKIAHEFGHVNYMIQADGFLAQRRKILTPIYQQISQFNGGNTSDPRLIELAKKNMRGPST